MFKVHKSQNESPKARFTINRTFFFFCAFSHLSISLPPTFTVWFCLPRFASLPVSFSVFFISSHQFGLVAGRLTDLQVLLISCLEREKHGTGCLVVSTLLNSRRRAWATSLIKHGRKWAPINNLYRSALSAFFKWRVASRRGSRPTSIAASWQTLRLCCAIGESWLLLKGESECVRKNRTSRSKGDAQKENKLGEKIDLQELQESLSCALETSQECKQT